MRTTLPRAGALSCGLSPKTHFGSRPGRRRRPALACGLALLATTCLTAPAAAQGQPSVYQHPDGNGVDLTDGSFNFSLVEGSIGAGQGALALVRQYGAGGLTDNLTARFHRTQSGGNTTIALVFGNRREEFSGAAGATSFASPLGNGATLTKVSESEYRYTDAGGAVTTYEAPPGLTDAPNNGYCSSVNEFACSLVPASTVQPDGLIVGYIWDAGENCLPNGQCAQFWRQRGLTNSFGYRVLFTFDQETNPSSGLPGAAWHRRATAVFSNTAVSGSPARTVSYDNSSSTVTVVTTDGSEAWRFSRDSQQRLTGIRRPGSGSDDISLSYAGSTSMVVSQIIADGVTTNYSRTVSGSTGTMTRTDALSQQLVVVSDLTKGRPTSVTDPTGRQTGFQYDPSARPTRVTQDEGNYTELTYDARGNVTETRAVAKPGTGLPDTVTAATFPCANPVTCNLPESVTDARGNVTEFTYDATHGGVLTVTAPAPSGGADRPQTRYSYTQASGETEYMLTAVSACASGTVASGCVNGANEARTAIGYDVNGNVTSLVRRNGDNSLSAPSAMSWDAHGNLLTVDGPLSGTADTVRFRYDAARRRIGTVSPDPDGAGSLKHRAMRTTYANGLPTAVETGTVDSQSDGDWAAMAVLERVEQAYDSNRRPVETRLISGTTTHALSQTGYDALGRVECAAQRMNPAEYASAQPNACALDTTSTTYGPDRIVRTSYDAAGRVTLAQSAYGVTGVQADEVATAYTDNGQVETVTDAAGNRTTYEYDGHDRLRNTRFPLPNTPGTSAPTSGTGADYEQLTYATATIGGVTRSTPLVASRRVRSGESLAYSYDALGRLTAIDRPVLTGGYYDLLDSFFTYDNLGRMTAATHEASDVPGRMVWNLSFAHDALGRMLSQTDPLGTVGYSYDAAGRRISMTYPGSNLVLGYIHFVTGEVDEIRENPAGNNVLLANYDYDDRGRRTLLTRGNGTTTSYGYDAVSRLSQLVQGLNGTSHDLTLDFTHNPASQIVSSTRSNDAFSFTGHANVNTTSAVNGLNQLTAVGGTGVQHDARGNLTYDGSRSFGYTSENLMISRWPHSLVYDPIGRLIHTDTATTYDRFSYDGHSLIVEYDGLQGDAVARRYVHGPGVDEPLVWYEGSGTSTRRWFHQDERGSVIAVSDASGNLVGSAPNRYDEYGVPQGTLTGRFGYTGQAWLPNVGLYYYRARMFDPQLGRFMQTDPIGYAAGMHLYGYVRNDPVNFTDPSGLTVCTGSRIEGACMNANSQGGVPSWSSGYSSSGWNGDYRVPPPPVSGDGIWYSPTNTTEEDEDDGLEQVIVVIGNIAQTAWRGYEFGRDSFRFGGEILDYPRDIVLHGGEYAPWAARYVGAAVTGQPRPARPTPPPLPRPPEWRAQTVDRTPELRREMQFHRDLRNSEAEWYRRAMEAALEAFQEFLGF